MSSPQEVASKVYGGKSSDYEVILPSDLNDFKKEMKKRIKKVIKKIREMPNRDDWLQKDLPMAKNILDGGGVKRLDVIDLIEKELKK